MTGHDAAIYSETERHEEQREAARRDVLRDELRSLRIAEEARAASVLAFSRALRREWTEHDPPDVLWAWRDAVDHWTEARDIANRYEKEHGL